MPENLAIGGGEVGPDGIILPGEEDPDTHEKRSGQILWIRGLTRLQTQVRPLFGASLPSVHRKKIVPTRRAHDPASLISIPAPSIIEFSITHTRTHLCSFFLDILHFVESDKDRARYWFMLKRLVRKHKMTITSYTLLSL